MLASFVIKTIVPAVLFYAAQVLADGSCAVTDNVAFTFFGLGSAGVYTKFGCSGTEVTAGSSVATGENAPHPSGGRPNNLEYEKADRGQATVLTQILLSSRLQRTIQSSRNARLSICRCSRNTFSMATSVSSVLQTIPVEASFTLICGLDRIVCGPRS